MNIKNTLIDIIEYGIWEVNHDYGKIKRTDIVRLSRIVEDLPEDAILTSAMHSDGKRLCEDCGQEESLCRCHIPQDLEEPFSRL